MRCLLPTTALKRRRPDEHQYFEPAIAARRYACYSVHGVLKRGSNTVSNFFSVSTDGAADSQQRPAIAEALAQERQATASELAVLPRALSDNPDAEEMRKRLDGLIRRLSLKAG
jgi:hypothetical protein